MIRTNDQNELREPPTVNRCALVLEPTAVYLAWAKGIPEEDEGLSLEDITRDSTCYLMIELSQLIDLLNERFGTDFKPADQLFLDQVREQAVADEMLRQAAAANTIENFKFVSAKALEDIFIDRMEQNEAIFARFMNDQEFQKLVEKHLRKQVYEQIRGQQTQQAETGAA